jgi:glycine cleavage system regulatory protein
LNVVDHRNQPPVKAASAATCWKASVGPPAKRLRQDDVAAEAFSPRNFRLFAEKRNPSVRFVSWTAIGTVPLENLIHHTGDYTMPATLAAKEGTNAEATWKPAKLIPAASNQTQTTKIAQEESPYCQDEPKFGFTAIWLDARHSKMTISITGIDHSGITSHIAERLKIRGINIESGFRAKLEQAAGTFFEITGQPGTMQDLYEEITQNRIEPPQEEEIPSEGTLYELEVIAPDRSGMLYDITTRLDECLIGIAHMVIKTKQTAEGRKGIVYARIIVRSEESLTGFKDRLGQIYDFEKWNWRCDTFENRFRPARPTGMPTPSLN